MKSIDWLLEATSNNKTKEDISRAIDKFDSLLPAKKPAEAKRILKDAERIGYVVKADKILKYKNDNTKDLKSKTETVQYTEYPTDWTDSDINKLKTGKYRIYDSKWFSKDKESYVYNDENIELKITPQTEIIYDVKNRIRTLDNTLYTSQIHITIKDKTTNKIKNHYIKFKSVKGEHNEKIHNDIKDKMMNIVKKLVGE